MNARTGLWRAAIASVVALLSVAILPAALDRKEKLAEPIAKGQRVYTCGHSFHVWVPGIVSDLAKKAEIKDHVQLGLSSIGGSKVIQHWDKADDRNSITVKDVLKTGKVDVLTLSPIFFPDAASRISPSWPWITTRTSASSCSRSGCDGTFTNRQPRSPPG